ncbi:MAG TPA: nucleoside hydrolase [Tepidisphaeraceae bacterium]|jgi:hypothetical protein|nr:nucleoside hydrolase [Tepidisphaeraceae bacterium]
MKRPLIDAVQGVAVLAKRQVPITGGSPVDIVRCVVAIALCVSSALCGVGQASTGDRAIIDTDFRTNCDDAGALAMLHALADRGECEIIGVVASTTGPHVVAAIDAVNTYYGRGDLPVGLSPRPSLPEGPGADNYAPALADPARFPSDATNATAPESTALYRKLLYGSPDGSVKIVVVGGQSCLAMLLQSAADHEADGSIGVTGADLVRAKVRETVIMGGAFRQPNRWEFNIKLDVKAADAVAQHWPGPIVYSGFEVGDRVMTGGTLQHPDTNPIALAYTLGQHTGDGVGKPGPRQSWDQTAVYYAVRGTGDAQSPLWRLSDPVTIRFKGKTEFAPAVDALAPDQLRRYLIDAAPKAEVAGRIDVLMLQPLADR